MRRLALFAIGVSFAACHRATQPAPPASRASVLLVTLDTTRADAVGPDATGVETSAFNALAARGRRFSQAYATAPETLPSHSSLMTGLYPAGHGVRENARVLSRDHPLLAERLHEAGYRTAAFVSTFVLARRFGLARGFDVYDDELPAGSAERAARETTDRALAQLQPGSTQPVLLWVHYYEPHFPYEPPEPFRSRYASQPYLGEVAAMDEQLGRLVEAFERVVPGPRAILVVGDHGEGLGAHGEHQHGNLLYQATMHVPLVMVGPGITPVVTGTPVSTRRVFNTVLDWAGLGATGSLRETVPEVVLGEAMKPFLSYGWQPQVMAVEGRHKTIQSGRLEVYDVLADPTESHDLAATAEPSRPVRTALREYPAPSLSAAAGKTPLDDEARRQLASLGYVSAGAAPVVRRDAPRAADMVGLFGVLEQASGLFVRGEYARAVPLLDKILAADAHNLDTTLRLATAHSMLGHDAQAAAALDRADAIAPGSPDVRAYRALHMARGPRWQRAVPLLEAIVAESPERLPALEALAGLRERQGRLDDAIALRQQVFGLRAPTAVELVRLGQLAMQAGRTPVATQSFERARTLQAGAFAHDLELGVLYLAARRFPEARDALDRVPATDPAYPMALFKRAQVSVLLREPDQAARIERARRRADRATRSLIASERLFLSRGAAAP